MYKASKVLLRRFLCLNYFGLREDKCENDFMKYESILFYVLKEDKKAYEGEEGESGVKKRERRDFVEEGNIEEIQRSWMERAHARGR
jgi:hypothetical protein